MLIFVPYVAFGYTLVNFGKYSSNEIFVQYGVAIQIGGFFLAKDNPITTLKIFSILGILGMLIGVFAAQLALFALYQEDYFVL